jgi:hypothetical protein
MRPNCIFVGVWALAASARPAPAPTSSVGLRRFRAFPTSYTRKSSQKKKRLQAQMEHPRMSRMDMSIRVVMSSETTLVARVNPFSTTTNRAPDGGSVTSPTNHDPPKKDLV